MKRGVALALLLSATFTCAQSPLTAQAWNPANIRCQKTNPDGTKWSVLEEDMDAPGKSFTYAVFLPAGYWNHPSHGTDARLAVVSGALKVAIGPKFDKEGAKTYGLGNFLFLPANVSHTMGTEVDSIIIGTATGPWTTHQDGNSEKAHGHSHHR